jgi:hypothetical protein
VAACARDAPGPSAWRHGAARAASILSHLAVPFFANCPATVVNPSSSHRQEIVSPMPASPARQFLVVRKSGALRALPDTAAAQAILDANGLRRTMARLVVLEALLGADRPDAPFTPIALHDELNRRGQPIGLPTVYAVLAALRKIGLVEPSDGQPPVDQPPRRGAPAQLLRVRR